ncbi:hypothetical protein EJ110_NYTH16273 [Nymphaea thermarum]|nr:hypothetical protein EJ110_NYTH16273 [Nymphaea thermarum]
MTSIKLMGDEKGIHKGLGFVRFSSPVGTQQSSCHLSLWLYEAKCLFFTSSLAVTEAMVNGTHMFIYGGDFVLQRSGKMADFCDGVQAHLSTCAPPKVIEAASGFPSGVQLEEMSRLATAVP